MFRIPGLGGIGVVEAETTGIQSVFPVISIPQDKYCEDS
jgi:hypothetical protein